MGTSPSKISLSKKRREHILSCYVRGEVSRDEAITAVGIDWVELAERQRQAMQEDVTWALEQ